ncbi:phage major capsid protein [uncultured Oscillibacter sp.]|uniref:phage major capsid protein n=1 Tax=uncultured Oscillibacter sp. TaxID=876091 RepID=UPI0025E141C8|nr:phage major capsid protein [uncultured Oscillibacter sp.]
MDFMEKITELRAKKRALSDQASALVAGDNLDGLDDITNQMEEINKNIQSLERSLEASRAGAEPVGGYDGLLHDGKSGGEPKDGARPFQSLGEQLQAIVAVAKSHTADKRLIQVNNAVLGANEGTGADGGFALQEDFAGTIIESAVQHSELLNRLDRYTCSSPANSMRWVSADETDISASVFGGVQMYWAAEGATVAASKPQLKEMKMDLEKMMGIAYATDEMLTDAAFMTGFFGTAFALAAERLLVSGVIAGDGEGKPKGFLKSKALITVDTEPGQAAGSFLGANAVKMQARAMPRNRERLVWLMHPDVEELLPFLSIQNGEAAKFLWNPEGGLGNFDTQRVLNKPVLFDDSCSALGAAGDINLIDPFQYILLTKGTARQDWSVHVEFLTDQNCFRMVYRCNGAPKTDSTLTIKNSTKARSPFITLAARGGTGAEG